MKDLLQNAADNIRFILISLLIIAGIVIIAALAQKYLCKSVPKRRGARYVVFVAMFGAVAAVLMMFEIPLFFAPSFYKIDLSEIPVLMCSFYLGPVAGVVCELIKIVIKLLLKNTSTMFVGDFANFVVGCTFVLPASVIYHIKKTKKNAVVGMVTGTGIMTIFGSLFNAIYLLPKFSVIYGLPLDAIVAMGTEINGAITNVSTLVLMAVVPFNLLKGIIVSAVTLFLYKRLEPVFFRN